MFLEDEETASPSLSGGKIKVLSVSQLNHQIRLLFDKVFPAVWVEGEVSNFKHHSSGHMYFTLKDDKSQISAVFFSGANRNLKFQLKDGLKIIVFGRVSSYEPRGQYQVYVEQVQPKGLGELQLAFSQLKEKLEKEGLFDPAHKKPIPKFPSVVGVVTSPTGAAIRDILNVIKRRFHGTQVLIYPVQVQGSEAAPQIAQAIRDMNQMAEAEVLIIGRGGGSLEDLWAFNEEIVARAVYASKIPIISAVGHEIDWTICDFVADLRAPTPSAAAELVVQSRVEIERRVMDSEIRIKNAVFGWLEHWKQNLMRYQSSHAFRQPRLLAQQFSQRVDDLMRQMQNYLDSLVELKAQSLQGIAGRLHALSPLAILRRGYAVTYGPDEKLLRSIRNVKAGQKIKTRLRDGIVESQVIKTESREDSHE